MKSLERHAEGQQIDIYLTYVRQKFQDILVIKYSINRYINARVLCMAQRT